ncbi:hypothetical protein ABZP36_011973 [Zizania latifolia]
MFQSPLLLESNSDNPIIHRVEYRIIRADRIEKHASVWRDADVIVFNSYLWWTKQKADMMMEVMYGSFEDGDARASNWGGDNSNKCLNETEPIQREEYKGATTDYSMMNKAKQIFRTLEPKGIHVEILNITHGVQEAGLEQGRTETGVDHEELHGGTYGGAAGRDLENREEREISDGTSPYSEGEPPRVGEEAAAAAEDGGEPEREKRSEARCVGQAIALSWPLMQPNRRSRSSRGVGDRPSPGQKYTVLLRARHDGDLAVAADEVRRRSA